MIFSLSATCNFEMYSSIYAESRYCCAYPVCIMYYVLLCITFTRYMHENNYKVDYMYCSTKGSKIFKLRYLLCPVCTYIHIHVLYQVYDFSCNRIHIMHSTT